MEKLIVSWSKLYFVHTELLIVSTCENGVNSSVKDIYLDLWMVFSIEAIFCDYLTIGARNITTLYHCLLKQNKLAVINLCC